MFKFFLTLVLNLSFAFAAYAQAPVNLQQNPQTTQQNPVQQNAQQNADAKLQGDVKDVNKESSEITEGGSQSEEASAEESGAFDLNRVINHHLGDSKLWDFSISGYDFPITKRVVMMWIAAILLMMIFIPAARYMAKNSYSRPGRFRGMVEVFVDFVRHDVGHSAMGHHSKSYEPFLLSLFFFILFSNLLGLIPPIGETIKTIAEFAGYHFEPKNGEVPLLVKLWPGITATGDLSVTATLAIVSFIVIQVTGFLYQGIAYIKNIVPAGVPWAIWPIMWPIELLGQIIKPFALAIRLLANMTAGHMLILVFIGFIFQFSTWLIVPVSIPVTTAIYLLEIFVAFLQAYIFVFLTALFIAGSQHRH